MHAWKMRSSWISAAGLRSVCWKKPATARMVTLTQTEIARRIGASREKVNRKLHDWNDEGFIELSRSGVKLKDKARLEALITRARNA